MVPQTPLPCAKITALFSSDSATINGKELRLRQNTAMATRTKHKIPRKKASGMMATLRAEQTATPLPYPDFSPGDALQVKMLPYKSAAKPVRLGRSRLEPQL